MNMKLLDETYFRWDLSEFADRDDARVTTASKAFVCDFEYVYLRSIHTKSSFILNGGNGNDIVATQ